MTEDTPNFTDNWLAGRPEDPNLVKIIVLARLQLEGKSEIDVRNLWNKLLDMFNTWANQTDTEPKAHFPEEEIEAWMYTDFITHDYADLLTLVLLPEKYQPLTELLKTESLPNLYAVLALAEAARGDSPAGFLSQYWNPSRITRSAQKAALELMLCDKNRLNIKIITKLVLAIREPLIEKAEKESRSKGAKKAAAARHKKNNRLKEKAIELYLNGDCQSTPQAAENILPVLEKFGKEELDYWLASDDPYRTIYEWLLEYNKKQ